MHDNAGVTKNEKPKLDMHVIYNHTKGGVGIVDLISTHNLARMKLKRWPQNTFAFLVDTTCNNAKTILSEWQSYAKLSDFEFTYCLSEILVLPNIDRRYSTSNDLSIDLVQLMLLFPNIIKIAEVSTDFSSIFAISTCLQKIHNF